MSGRRKIAPDWDDSLPGLRRKVLVYRDGVELTLYRIEPGCLFPAHSHPEAQFGYMLEGRGVQRVSGIVRRVRAGEGWYIPPSAPHEFETGPLGTVVLLNVLMDQPDGTSPNSATAQHLLAEAADRYRNDTSRVHRAPRGRAREAGSSPAAATAE